VQVVDRERTPMSHLSCKKDDDDDDDDDDEQ
jgi:hypothetical protein